MCCGNALEGEQAVITGGAQKDHTQGHGGIIVWIYNQEIWLDTENMSPNFVLYLSYGR